MIIVGILGWWYGAGWVQAGRAVRARIASMVDYFSIDLLLKTLFAPFRQISAGRVNGPLPVQLRAFADRLLSRVIGAIVRTLVMCIGVIAITLVCVAGLVYLVLWALVPLAPIAGLIMMLIGWLPWTIK
ncbi:hypothetical protein CR983_03180 [Candidatus Saccharibacteria bacterium]|nr:MAG: hypothetical protein CR983_03180 [Candidatus Saccharibacteria bacterium]